MLVREPRLALALQVVELEQPKVDRFAARLALGAQSFKREAEQVAYPLLLKKLLHCARSRRLAACQFTFGGLEIERHQDRVAAAFDAPRRLVLVGHKAVHAGPQKSSQARLRRIVTVEKTFLHHPGEKLLCQVFGVLVGLAPAGADVLVDRLPVGGDDSLESTGALGGIVTTGRHDGRPPRGWKPAARATDLCVV